MKAKTYITGMVVICILGIVMDSLIEGAVAGVLWCALFVYKRIASGEYGWDLRN